MAVLLITSAHRMEDFPASPARCAEVLEIIYSTTHYIYILYILYYIFLPLISLLLMFVCKVPTIKHRSSYNLKSLLMDLMSCTEHYYQPCTASA